MSKRRREKLDLIFRLEYKNDDEEILANRSRLVELVKTGGVEDFQVLRAIVGVLRQFDITEFNVRGESISIESYLKKVEKQGKWSEPVEAGGLSFRFGHVVAMKHSFLSIEEVSAGSARNWSVWIEPFLMSGDFVQAWVSDVDYDYWQNARSPAQYVDAGRDYSKLPTKSNGLPPPLEQIEIDISGNPGRWELRFGYVEAVGAVMWLGLPFWECFAENRKKALLEEGWINVQSIGGDVIKLIVCDHCFFDETTSDKQNKLRAVLYGQ